MAHDLLSASPSTGRRRPAVLALDLLAVLVFVIVGRDTHDEGSALPDVLATATPFLVGVAVGWMITRAWRRPLATPVGAGVAISTVVVGMVLRRVAFDDGTAPSFIAVASGFLLITQPGWRWMARRVLRLSHR